MWDIFILMKGENNMVFKDLKSVLGKYEPILIILYDEYNSNLYFCGYADSSFITDADSYKVLGVGNHNTPIICEYGPAGYGTEVILDVTHLDKEDYKWLTKNSVSGIFCINQYEMIKSKYIKEEEK